jgi:hypothetical protein
MTITYYQSISYRYQSLAPMTQTIECFIADLGRRGLTLRLMGNRIQAFDATGLHAWPSLTGDEVVFIRANRSDLKRHLQGLPPLPRPEVPVAVAATPEKKAPVPEHIRRVIDFNTPEENERRRAEATAVMLRTLGQTSPLL